VSRERFPEGLTQGLLLQSCRSWVSPHARVCRGSVEGSWCDTAGQIQQEMEGYMNTCL